MAEIEKFRIQQFSSTFTALLAQRDSRFAGLVDTGSHTGKSAAPVNQTGTVTLRDRASRFAPITFTEVPTDRRWVFPNDKDLYVPVDKQDIMRLVANPIGPFTERVLDGARRKKDDVIIPAFFADAQTGEAGATTTTFPASQQVAVNFESASNVGLTVAKLREAKRLFMANDFDLDSEPLFIAVNAKAHDNLLKEIQVISADFNVSRDGAPVMKEGRIERFLGFNFIHSERLENDATPYRRIPVWAKSGMYLGVWDEIRTDLTERKDLEGHPWQISVFMTIGATRLEEKRVVEIKANEA